MGTHTRVNIKLARLVARAGIIGNQGSFTMACGFKAINRGTVSGKASKVTHTLVSGRTTSPMDSVSTSGVMATDTKENGSSVSDMVRDVIFLHAETLTSASMLTVKLKGTASTDGPMATYTPASSIMA